MPEDKIKEAFAKEVWSDTVWQGCGPTALDIYQAGYMACLNSTEDHNDTDRLDWLINGGRIVICDREGCYTYSHTSGRYGPIANDPRVAIDKAMESV